MVKEKTSVVGLLMPISPLLALLMPNEAGPSAPLAEAQVTQRVERLGNIEPYRLITT